MIDEYLDGKVAVKVHFYSWNEDAFRLKRGTAV